jgi:hypothetical protein
VDRNRSETYREQTVRLPEITGSVVTSVVCLVAGILLELER